MYWMFAGIVVVIILAVNIYLLLKKPADITEQVQNHLMPLPAAMDYDMIDRILEYEQNLPLRIETFEEMVEGTQAK